MMQNTPVLDIIQQYFDPYLNQTWQSAKALKNVRFEKDKVSIDIVLGYPILGLHERYVTELKNRILATNAVREVEINLSFQISAHAVQPRVPADLRIKNIIAVASGKGGVGKSTTAVNIAAALSLDGARVGILDADIYGPNQPHMLGETQPPQVQENKKFIPVVRHGLQSMSMGYLVNPETPMIWRGPMVTTALQQLLRDTLWEDLDYLIIDLPPGTGDIQLTLAQKIPVSAAVVVTTPQDIALLDARKALEMFHKVKIPVLGIIENMSVHICRQCGYHENIFGADGGKRLADAGHSELLGQLPLDIRIREQSDQGTPVVIADPTAAIANQYRDIARKLAAKLSLHPKNYALKFPKIVVE